MLAGVKSEEGQFATRQLADQGALLDDAGPRT